MKTTCGRQWLFVATALVLSSVRATADDAYSGDRLIQARFDQLIATSYPTIGARFDRLIQTTWPLTDPGIGKVPITENLVHPLDQPLVIVNEGWGSYLQLDRSGSLFQSFAKRPLIAIPRRGLAARRDDSELIESRT